MASQVSQLSQYRRYEDTVTTLQYMSRSRIAGEGEEKTSVEVKPHCYLNSREIRLPRTPARREA